MVAVTCPTCSTSFVLLDYMNHAPSCYAAKCEELNITPRCVCPRSQIIHPDCTSDGNRKRLQSEYTVFDSSLINTMLPPDMLSLVLSSFQQNEQSFFVGLVCKKWNSIIKRNRKIHLGQVTKCYSKEGSMNALSLLEKTNHRFLDNYSKYVYYGAAESGNLEIFDTFVFSKGYPFNRTTCEIAAGNGHENIIRYIYDKIAPWKNSEEYYNEWIETIEASAARNGHLNILKIKPKVTSCDSVLKEALSHGQLKVADWIVEKNFFKMERFTCYAVSSMETVMWYTNRTDKWRSDVEIFCNAVISGNLEVVKYCRERGCIWEEKLFCCAAEKGYFDIIQYLKDNNCPWDSNATNAAAKHGNLEILKWLIDNNCPIYASTLPMCAIQSGNLDLILWTQTTLNIKYKRAKYCVLAIEDDHLHVLQWLLDSGCQVDIVVLILAIKKQLSLEIQTQIWTSVELSNSEKVLRTLGKYGTEELISWYSQKYNPEYSQWRCILIGAIKGDQFQSVKKVYRNSFICIEDLPMNKISANKVSKWIKRQEE